VSSGTYAGDNSIVTLGTVTTGVWNGTAVPVAYGGTGSTSASAARTALGLAIGADVLAYNAYAVPDAAGAIWQTSNRLAFEGSTADGVELFLDGSLVSGTDKVIYIPNSSGSFMVDTSTSLSPGDANATWFESGSLVSEGATGDAYELTVTFPDVTADTAIAFPAKAGTVEVSTAYTNKATTTVVTPGKNAFVRLTGAGGSFGLDTTDAVPGMIYVFMSNGDAHTMSDNDGTIMAGNWTTPGDGDTITMVFDGTYFVELARSNN
jgi:hypothetical protein